MLTKLRVVLALALFAPAIIAPASALADTETQAVVSAEPPRPGDEARPTGDPAEIRNDHGTATDCVQCHGSRPEPGGPSGPAGTVELIAPVPRLCFTCHEEYTSLATWVHGPVVAGDCLFCHDAHASDHPSLLTRPVPDLCYQCHIMETLRLVEGHSAGSDQACGDCHESHASPHRNLLTPAFLATEAGADYAHRQVDRRPQYTFVDRRGSLAGLRGVKVIATIERSQTLSRYGLAPDLLKAQVERGLRQRGVKVLSDEGPASGPPELRASLRLIELHTPGYLGEVTALSGALSVCLRQTVELLSVSSDAQRRLCTATTWDTSAVVVWGAQNIEEGLAEAVDVLVGRFCTDYLDANTLSDEVAQNVLQLFLPRLADGVVRKVADVNGGDPAIATLGVP